MQGVYKSHSVEETKSLGKKLAMELLPGDIVLLSGNLGYGKTCFIQGIAEGLGITEPVNSPTYVYVHSYVYQKSFLYHIDLYRVTEPEKLESIGLDEAMQYTNNILLVEWPEILQKRYPTFQSRRCFSISFRKISDTEREIVFEMKDSK